MPTTSPASRRVQPSAVRIALACVVGTAIEFYDFYIYGTAAVLVLGRQFFPAGASGAASLAAFATFGIAFVARPFGSFLFGHFGDRVGRKATLVASLLLMGLSTTAIGMLPGYGTAGIAAPLLLCLLRLGQGIGLGGEWGGAALLATENAPPGRRAWFGMFPQLGPSIGFLLANGLFLAVILLLTDAQFQAWGWRIPFLFSAVLVLIGLYLRRQIGETPEFETMRARKARVRVPLLELLVRHGANLALGSLAMVASYATFYIATIFSFDYETRVAGISHGEFLGLLCIAIGAMALTTVLAARLADRFSARKVVMAGAVLAALSGFATQPLLGQHSATGAFGFLLLELGIMGIVFAPMGSLLPALFPPEVRYTGASAAYSIGGILGASLAPYAAQRLVAYGGLRWVGFYITVAAAISLVAAFLIRERETWNTIVESRSMPRRMN